MGWSLMKLRSAQFVPVFGIAKFTAEGSQSIPSIRFVSASGTPNPALLSISRICQAKLETSSLDTPAATLTLNFGILAVKNMKFVIWSIVMVLGCNSFSNTRLFERSSSILSVRLMFDWDNSKFSRVCNLFEKKLPIISTAKPKTNTKNPSDSTGSNNFSTVLAIQRNSSKVGVPILQRKQRRNVLFLLHFTMYSAPSSITPGITMNAPINASQAQPSNDEKKEESIKNDAKAVEAAQIITIIALGFLFLFAIIDFVIICVEYYQKQRKTD
jgi:hypothetical protein